MSDGKVIKCGRCDLPVARVVGGTLVIECRHHGEKHVKVIEVGELVTIANKQVAEMRGRLATRELVASPVSDH